MWPLKLTVRLRCAGCDVIFNTGERPRVYNTFYAAWNSLPLPELKNSFKIAVWIYNKPILKTWKNNNIKTIVGAGVIYFFFIFLNSRGQEESVVPFSAPGVYLRIRRKREYHAMAALRLVHSCSLRDLLSLLVLSRRGGFSRSLWGNVERHRTNSVASPFFIMFPAIATIAQVIFKTLLWTGLFSSWISEPPTIWQKVRFLFIFV